MGRSSRVLGPEDAAMWESIANRQWALQFCPDSGSYRYPPSPICPESLSMEYEWRPIRGTGEILSWVIFHRQYFDDYAPPYNAIAVRLTKGRSWFPISSARRPREAGSDGGRGRVRRTRGLHHSPHAAELGIPPRRQAPGFADLAQAPAAGC